MGLWKRANDILLSGFLARWAKRLSWKETSRVFESSWDTVFRAVTFVVDYGLANRNLDGITKIGVDEIAVFKGHELNINLSVITAKPQRV